MVFTDMFDCYTCRIFSSRVVVRMFSQRRWPCDFDVLEFLIICHVHSSCMLEFLLSLLSILLLYFYINFTKMRIGCKLCLIHPISWTFSLSFFYSIDIALTFKCILLSLSVWTVMEALFWYWTYLFEMAYFMYRQLTSGLAHWCERFHQNIDWCEIELVSVSSDQNDILEDTLIAFSQQISFSQLIY